MYIFILCAGAECSSVCANCNTKNCENCVVSYDPCDHLICVKCEADTNTCYKCDGPVCPYCDGVTDYHEMCGHCFDGYMTGGRGGWR